MLSRMKYISRWGLMRNVLPENLCEHTLQTAYIAHALAAMHNLSGGSVDTGKVVLHALYHDCGEILTGDLPTPVKYHNETMKNAYKQLEKTAEERMLSMLPDELRPEYLPYFRAEDAKIIQIVKAADKLAALIKCIEEKQMGNADFDSAYDSVKKGILETKLPEAQEYIRRFIPSFGQPIDELER